MCNLHPSGNSASRLVKQLICGLISQPRAIPPIPPSLHPSVSSSICPSCPPCLLSLGTFLSFGIFLGWFWWIAVSLQVYWLLSRRYCESCDCSSFKLVNLGILSGFKIIFITAFKRKINDCGLDTAHSAT